jgi:hypothetical protein
MSLDRSVDAPPEQVASQTNLIDWRRLDVRRPGGSPAPRE